MHGKRAGALEPQLVSRPLEKRQKCIAVARRAVTEVRALRQRTGEPRELTAREEQPPVLLVTGRHPRQRRHHARRAVAPLRPDRPVSIGPTDSPWQRSASSSRARPPRLHTEPWPSPRGDERRSSSMRSQGEHAAREAMRGTDPLLHLPAAKPLRPEIRLRIPLGRSATPRSRATDRATSPRPSARASLWRRASSLDCPRTPRSARLRRSQRSARRGGRRSRSTARAGATRAGFPSRRP